MNNKVKRIMAWICILLLAGMYIVTMVLALSGNEAWHDLLMASFVSTVVFPCLLYIFFWVARLLSGSGQAGAEDPASSDSKNSAGGSGSASAPSGSKGSAGGSGTTPGSGIKEQEDKK